MNTNRLRLGLLIASVVLSVVFCTFIGCGQSESQAVREIATQAMHEQTEQNRRVTESTRDLVASDARARQDMIEAHARLQETLQEERSNLDQQQADLNELRDEIELDRRRAPIIAEAIHIVGGVIASLIPLLLAGYVLYCVNRTSLVDEQQIVNEFLIGELTSDSTRLLPSVNHLGIADQRSAESAERAEADPPF